MTSVTLVVLAAGMGERFGGLKQLAPVGPGGHSLMDYSICGALSAGCEDVVVVVRSEIEAAIRAHLDEVWAGGPQIRYVDQPVNPSTGKPGGTALAVLECRSAVAGNPFVVINADDLYLPPVLAALQRWLTGSGASHAVVGFPLGLTVLPESDPVTRAMCSRRADSALERLIESKVERRGDRFVARPLDGGREMVVGPAQLVSMNAWGFRPSIWPALESAVAGSRSSDGELFLPVVMSGLAGRGAEITVLPVDARCFGVTWSHDLGWLQKEVQQLVDAGVYPRRLGPSG
jgi:hypothetical protein